MESNTDRGEGSSRGVLRPSGRFNPSVFFYSLWVVADIVLKAREWHRVKFCRLFLRVI